MATTNTDGILDPDPTHQQGGPQMQSAPTKVFPRMFNRAGVY